MKLRNKIITESFRVLIFASLLSSIGGVALKSIETKLVLIIPIIIIIPALSDMIGDFGMIMVNKFATYLYLRKQNKSHSEMHFVKHFFVIIFPIAIMASIYISVMAIILAALKGFNASPDIVAKVMLITILSTIFLITVVFLVAIFGSLYVFKKNMNPDDLLIPITTSVADLGTMVFLMLLVRLFF